MSLMPLIDVPVKNHRQATVADIETNALDPEDVTKVHVISYSMYPHGKDNLNSLRGDDVEGVKRFIKHHIDNEIPIVFHNAAYDLNVLRLFYKLNLSKLSFIDSLRLSEQFFERKRYGLAYWGEEFGVKKPEVEDFVNITVTEAKHRCEEDVKITVLLWRKIFTKMESLYGITTGFIKNKGKYHYKKMKNELPNFLERNAKDITPDNLVCAHLTFMSYKVRNALWRECTKVKFDRKTAEEGLKKLESLLEPLDKIIVDVMPKKAVYSAIKRPSSLYKKDGSPSLYGKKWFCILEQIKKSGEGTKDEDGNPFYKKIIKDKDGIVSLNMLSDYEQPKATSHEQVKKWLFSIGWEPEIFDKKRNDTQLKEWELGGKKGPKPDFFRKIPKIKETGTGTICPWIVANQERHPALKALVEHSVISHRITVFNGLLESEKNGYVKATISGFTRTLRDKHSKPLVNLPSVNAPFAQGIRDSLIARNDMLMGCPDLTALEDTIKKHFMFPHDTKYVEKQLEGNYDPHLYICMHLGLLSEDTYNGYVNNTLSAEEKEVAKNIRKKTGKPLNYGMSYGMQAQTLSEKMKTDLQTAKNNFKGYWDLNKGITLVTKEQFVVDDSDGLKWMLNPVNGLVYRISGERDLFNTLCQGTGSFFFDMWVSQIIKTRKNKKVLGAWHDEVLLEFKKGEEVTFEEIMNASLQRVNEVYNLRLPILCDTQIGKNYAEVH